MVPVQVESRVLLRVPIRVALHTRDPARLEAQLRSGALHERGKEYLVVDVDEAHPVGDDSSPLARYRAPSFLVDFDAGPVEALAARLGEEAGAAPSVGQLVGFTRRSIRPGPRAFDVASQVASLGRGDCTEHAVLFTALARRFGYAARIAVGVILAETEGEAFAAGHAWAEIHQDGRWELVDPTNIEGAEVIAYFPEAWLENEGPGYAIQLLTARMIESIALIGNPPLR